jgi:hypothetical protein
MSNAADCAELQKPATRQKIATAIAQGIADYVSANPTFDTRLINPRAVNNGGLPVLEKVEP